MCYVLALFNILVLLSREVTGGDLAQLTSAVNLPGFTATWGYIVSWVAVPAYPGTGSVR